MSRLVASWVSGCLLLIPVVVAAGGADANGPAREGSDSGAVLEAVVVTGSYIRRTDTESPSPVDVIRRRGTSE